MADVPYEFALDIREVNHYFGSGELKTHILKGINLAIRPGELVIMTGPSGCGKTTLLTLIGGLRKVQRESESLKVLGKEMLGLDDAGLIKLRRDIGFIFQAHNLFESLTALQNVTMAIELKDVDRATARKKAEEALIAVDLEQRIGYKPKGLSGGQRQRVAVARALVNQPKLILADEPTAALDAKSTTLVLEQMRRLTSQGSTILIVTHDVKILNLADRIVSMAEGRIKSNEMVTESIRLCMYLSRCPAFASLKPEALANLASTMVPERFDPGDVIIRQGDEGDRFYLINHGKVDVLRDDGAGPRKLVTLEEGNFFGEASLMEDKPRNATVVATTPLDVYTIDKPRFRQAMESTASIREQILKVLYQRQ